MGNRIFTVVVVLLWAATMSWLLVAKILPPFFGGEPPYLGSLERQQPVCWQIVCVDQPVGWAVSQVVPGSMGTTEIHSRVLLEDIPLREMAPQWMGSLVNGLGPIQLDMRNRVALDTLGQLSTFDAKVWLNDAPSVLRMTGRVKDSGLHVQFESGNFTHKVRYATPSKSMLGGELTPDAKLLQMYVGRKWQKEVYSPFRTPNQAVELVQAEVVGEDTIPFEGQLVKTKQVEYRSLESAGVSADDALRARLWVADDGTVLRQDVYLFNVRLRFIRKQDEPSEQRAVELLDLDSVATAVNPRR
jgi:hypothetical protein